MDLPDKIGILGLGSSGVAACRALINRDDSPINIIAADEKTLSDLPLRDRIADLQEKGLEVVTGPGSFDKVARRGLPLIVLSPGIPKVHPVVSLLAQSGTTLWSELELGYRLLPTRPFIIAVTGTKGKGTTVRMIGSILEVSGIPSVIGGNIGRPLCDLLQEASNAKVLVLEVSSFQLAFVDSFRPDVAVFTCFFPDHLDWHPSLEDYRESKEKIFQNQKPSDWAVLNADDPSVVRMAAKVMGRIMWCGKSVAESCPYCTHWARSDDEYLWVSMGAHEFPVCRWSQFPFRGLHNRYNALLAVGAALLAGADPGAVADGLTKTPQVRHRLEIVGQINGVTFVNDSAATVPEAVGVALESFQEPIHLIAGGRSKGTHWEKVLKTIKERVVAVYGIGSSGRDLCEVIRKKLLKDSLYCETLDEAVKKAFERAKAGEVILLSPGSASFDQFRSYEERGDRFCHLVADLQKESVKSEKGD
ncbi:MAG: UDP-N-acetylmuramoyl-L-alanine--D-glutamate ligase [Armatimonadetes bacterium]|nr:UDP-N-acetylmuramoyl-L-alanine--D-glutamate ligase [Armatimonadota bacterium]MDW8121531.1 UDP-N-acetylmuramoyl-L-alanine--D-glutamate ligase [Armatimonadota bacterium]